MLLLLLLRLEQSATEKAAAVIASTLVHVIWNERERAYVLPLG
jgi:hypothetical protein